jgi:hypothetical protein
MNRFRKNLAAIILVSGVTSSTLAEDRGIVIREASGIARDGDRLLMVGDDADGRYFEIHMDDTDRPIIPIVPEKVREVVMAGAGMAMDLEAIDLMADGRVAVLSEQQRCLIAPLHPGDSRYVVIAEYDRVFTEFGNLGLEGLALTEGEGGRTKVAVMWEGGYPVLGDVPPPLRARVGGMSLKPVVVIHEIEGGEAVPGRIGPLKTVTLQVPEPPGDEPFAQRFRGTDLVWHRWKEGGEWKDGFIVLLMSMNAPPAGSGEPVEYMHKRLQRFGLNGEPVGDPLDLKEACRSVMGESAEEVCRDLKAGMADHLRDVISRIEGSRGEEINWEGLDWFEEGERLITIYDTWPKDPPFALIIQIPEAWK